MISTRYRPPTAHPYTTSTIATSTVGFLVSCSCTWTTELLRLTSPAIRHQQRSVVLHKCLFQLVLRIFVDEFLIVGHDRFCDCLSDCVDLGCMTTSCHSDSDIDTGEFVEANNEERFVDLDAVRRTSIHIEGNVTTLNRRISGWMSERGLPFTLTRPFPF